jgi:hypothetical protein
MSPKERETNHWFANCNFNRQGVVMNHNILLATALIGTAFILAPFGKAQNIPSGTRIAVRSNDTIDARDRVDGRIYTGQVFDDVLGPDGRVVIPRGANAELIVRRMGSNDLAIDLESVTVEGRRYSIDASATDRTRREGVGENKRTGEYVGGGAVLGTILGAIAGGGKGAAIGAIAGGAVGASAQIATRGEAVHIPAETVLTFRVDRPMDIYADPGYDRDGRHYHRFDDRDNQDGDRKPQSEGSGIEPRTN